MKNVDPNKNVLPISGSREGLFSFIQSAIDSTKPRPIVIIPNPFYKIYEGAALMAGAEPYFVNSLEDEALNQTSIVYPRNLEKLPAPYTLFAI